MTEAEFIRLSESVTAEDLFMYLIDNIPEETLWRVIRGVLEDVGLDSRVSKDLEIHGDNLDD